MTLLSCPFDKKCVFRWYLNFIIYIVLFVFSIQFQTQRLIWIIEGHGGTFETGNQAHKGGLCQILNSSCPAWIAIVLFERWKPLKHQLHFVGRLMFDMWLSFMYILVVLLLCGCVGFCLGFCHWLLELVVADVNRCFGRQPPEGDHEPRWCINIIHI